MKTIIVASLLLTGGNIAQAGPLKYVDQTIGTGGHGHTFLGPTRPFGAIQPGPNNYYGGWDWSSGYHYSTKELIGFSQTHLSGTGCADLGDLLIMPFTGTCSLEDSSIEDPVKGYPVSSTYDHANQTARPDYYSVKLDRFDTRLEIAATERVALYRLTYPKNEKGRLYINLIHSNGDRVTDSFIQKVDDHTVVGYRNSSGWANDQRLFFAIQTDQPIDSIELFNGDTPTEGDQLQSTALRAILNFGSVKKPVQVKVAISPVSSDNALANIKAELNHWKFDKVVKQTAAAWDKELGKINITADDKTKTIFYTSMYHSMIAPVLFNDANGDYRGTDKKVYKNPGFNNYTTFSLWDTYRTQHPLLTIYQPERVNDMINSMLAIYQQQGMLPIWHLMGCETQCMVGYHSVPPIIDAYFKGFDGFDVELAYKAVVDTAMNDRMGVKFLKEMGYIPGDKENEAVAKSMEYAIDDHCIAMMAKALGKTEDYEYFLNRSKVYAQYFDKEIQFMRGKMADGSWRTPFDPIEAQHRVNDYCEGNAWQYTWLVPHDPHGLIDLFGSEEAYLAKLDTLFSMSSELKEGASSDISGLIGQYAHGNEPSHHTIYMYAFAGQQWKSAQRVRQVLSTLYTDQRDGICGNEDCGQMSAWYIMSAMGFYPVHPANGVYVIGSPCLDKAKIRQPGGKTFTMTAENNSPENIYIQSVTYNGKPYTKSYITHDMITSGGDLVFKMGPAPNEQFGAAKEDRP